MYYVTFPYLYLKSLLPFLFSSSLSIPTLYYSPCPFLSFSLCLPSIPPDPLYPLTLPPPISLKHATILYPLCAPSLFSSVLVCCWQPSGNLIRSIERVGPAGPLQTASTYINHTPALPKHSHTFPPSSLPVPATPNFWQLLNHLFHSYAGCPPTTIPISRPTSQPVAYPEQPATSFFYITLTFRHLVYMLCNNVIAFWERQYSASCNYYWLMSFRLNQVILLALRSS